MMKRILLILLMVLCILSCRDEKRWTKPLFNTYHKECVYNKVMIVHNSQVDSGITLDLDENGKPIPCQIGDLIDERESK